MSQANYISAHKLTFPEIIRNIYSRNPMIHFESRPC